MKRNYIQPTSQALSLCVESNMLLNSVVVSTTGVTSEESTSAWSQQKVWGNTSNTSKGGIWNED